MRFGRRTSIDAELRVSVLRVFDVSENESLHNTETWT